MKHLSLLHQVVQRLAQGARRSAGFTMIELLVVIAILGILAVAVLSAINPVEQINRGRDTGSRSDAEQLINAIDRYYAFQGYAPWKTSPILPAPADTLAWMQVVNGTPFVDNASPPCPVLTKLSQTNGACIGADELKTSFTTRIVSPTYNPLYIYNRGTQGDSTYVCFQPQSGAFKAEALTRCTANNTLTAPAGLPTDLQPNGATICNTATPYICLP